MSAAPLNREEGIAHERNLLGQEIPEVRLWLEVLLQAIEHARGEIRAVRYSAESRPAHRRILRERLIRNAQQWLEGPGRIICAMIGLDHEAVMDQVRSE